MRIKNVLLLGVLSIGICNCNHSTSKNLKKTGIRGLFGYYTPENGDVNNVNCSSLGLKRGLFGYCIEDEKKFKQNFNHTEPRSSWFSFLTSWVNQSYKKQEKEEDSDATDSKQSSLNNATIKNSSNNAIPQKQRNYQKDISIADEISINNQANSNHNSDSKKTQNNKPLDNSNSQQEKCEVVKVVKNDINNDVKENKINLEVNNKHESDEEENNDNNNCDKNINDKNINDKNINDKNINDNNINKKDVNEVSEEKANDDSGQSLLFQEQRKDCILTVIKIGCNRNVLLQVNIGEETKTIEVNRNISLEVLKKEIITLYGLENSVIFNFKSKRDNPDVMKGGDLMNMFNEFEDAVVQEEELKKKSDEFASIKINTTDVKKVENNSLFDNQKGDHSDTFFDLSSKNNDKKYICNCSFTKDKSSIELSLPELVFGKTLKIEKNIDEKKVNDLITKELANNLKTKAYIKNIIIKIEGEKKKIPNGTCTENDAAEEYVSDDDNDDSNGVLLFPPEQKKNCILNVKNISDSRSRVSLEVNVDDKIKIIGVNRNITLTDLKKQVKELFLAKNRVTLKLISEYDKCYLNKNDELNNMFEDFEDTVVQEEDLKVESPKCEESVSVKINSNNPTPLEIALRALELEINEIESDTSDDDEDEVVHNTEKPVYNCEFEFNKTTSQVDLNISGFSIDLPGKQEDEKIPELIEKVKKIDKNINLEIDGVGLKKVDLHITLQNFSISKPKCIDSKIKRLLYNLHFVITGNENKNFNFKIQYYQKTLDIYLKKDFKENIDRPQANIETRLGSFIQNAIKTKDETDIKMYLKDSQTETDIIKRYQNINNSKDEKQINLNFLKEIIVDIEGYCITQGSYDFFNEIRNYIDAKIILEKNEIYKYLNSKLECGENGKLVANDKNSKFNIRYFLNYEMNKKNRSFRKQIEISHIINNTNKKKLIELHRSALVDIKFRNKFNSMIKAYDDKLGEYNNEILTFLSFYNPFKIFK